MEDEVLLDEVEIFFIFFGESHFRVGLDGFEDVGWIGGIDTF